MSKSVARRCKMGCGSWPDTEAYIACPNCGEPTQRFQGMTPMSDEEAESRVKHVEFERFYDEEWVQDNSPLTDEEFEEIVGLQGLSEPDLLVVPPAKNPARISGSPRPSPRRGLHGTA